MPMVFCFERVRVCIRTSAWLQHAPQACRMQSLSLWRTPHSMKQPSCDGWSMAKQTEPTTSGSSLDLSGRSRFHRLRSLDPRVRNQGSRLLAPSTSTARPPDANHVLPRVQAGAAGGGNKRRKQSSTKAYRKLVLLLQKSPKVSGNLRDFAG